MKLAVLTEIQQVFLNKCSTIAEALVNLQYSLKVDSDHLARVLTFGSKLLIFRSPYSGIFTDIILIQII